MDNLDIAQKHQRNVEGMAAALALIPGALEGGGMRDSVKMTGTLRLVLKNEETGEIKEDRLIENLVVNGGKALINARLIGTTGAVPTHMGVGTNNTAAAAADAALGTELTKVALTSSTPTNNATAFVATFGAGVGTGAIVEAGLFNGNAAVATGLSYTRSGNDITITKTSHGLAQYRPVGIAAATDSANNGGWLIKSITDANNFVVQTNAAGANGTLSLYQDVLILRTVFSVVNKGASDSLTITWTLTIS